jgi:hypothetical protein
MCQSHWKSQDLKTSVRANSTPPRKPGCHLLEIKDTPIPELLYPKQQPTGAKAEAGLTTVQHGTALVPSSGRQEHHCPLGSSEELGGLVGESSKRHACGQNRLMNIFAQSIKKDTQILCLSVGVVVVCLSKFTVSSYFRVFLTLYVHTI